MIISRGSSVPSQRPSLLLPHPCPASMQDMPAKYIYEPWTAPLSVQQAAACVIGRDYPAPIVDHAVVMKANLAKMKAAYDAAKGTVPEGLQVAAAGGSAVVRSSTGPGGSGSSSQAVAGSQTVRAGGQASPAAGTKRPRAS